MFTKFVYSLDKLIQFNETSREPASLRVFVQPLLAAAAFLIKSVLVRKLLL